MSFSSFFSLHSFPYASVLLAVSLVGAYFFLSSGALFVPQPVMDQYAASSSNPVGLFTNLFVHVGVLHLLGNLVPLVLFALVLEGALGAVDVLSIFVLSGVAASFVYSVLNPSALLVGASTGVSGVMAACALARPRQALALLLAVPLVLYIFAFPVASALVSAHESQLAGQVQNLSMQVAELNASGNSTGAAQAGKQLAEVNASAASVSEGVAREKSIPSDALVHVVGALVGLAYMLFVRREVALEGVGEVSLLVDGVRQELGRLRGEERE